jgi:hypothetical protein
LFSIDVGRNRDSSVGIAITAGCTAEKLRFQFPAGTKHFFLSSTAPRRPLGPTHPHIQWVAGALSKREDLDLRDVVKYDWALRNLLKWWHNIKCFQKRDNSTGELERFTSFWRYPGDTTRRFAVPSPPPKCCLNFDNMIKLMRGEICSTPGEMRTAHAFKHEYLKEKS